MEKKKNWLKEAVNPNHKGFCTPMSKSTCTGHRRAFALTMKKHHGFHKKEFGGKIKDVSGVYESLNNGIGKIDGDVKKGVTAISNPTYMTNYIGRWGKGFTGYVFNRRLIGKNNGKEVSK